VRDNLFLPFPVRLSNFLNTGSCWTLHYNVVELDVEFIQFMPRKFTRIVFLKKNIKENIDQKCLTDRLEYINKKLCGL
jgi:hypothetical protein